MYLCPKEYLLNIGFEVPNLKLNMRNCNSVVTTFDSIYGMGKQRLDFVSDGVTQYVSRTDRTRAVSTKLAVPRAQLPPSTVEGVKTVVVPVPQRDRPVDTLPTVMKKYFEDDEEPVVILLTEPKFLEEVEKKMKESKRKVLMFNSSSTEPLPPSKIVELKEYLKDPKGVLLTEAEAFNGMQSRNIIVVGKNSKAVRNYILRGISFVVFIQRIRFIERYIDHNSSVTVDKSFLSENIQKNTMLMRALRNEIWLWHLPCGVDEKIIKDHLLSLKQTNEAFTGLDVEEVVINKVLWAEERVEGENWRRLNETQYSASKQIIHAGYRLSVPLEFQNQLVVNKYAEYLSNTTSAHLTSYFD